ncbi:MAG: DnaA N-terminal domain-containing protein, partial [Candidatus Peribacteraceae bacterium]
MTPSVDLDLWLKVLGKLEPKLQRGQFITWFKDTTILGREEKTVVVGLPLPMYLNWHLEHYRSMTLATIREIDPEIEQVVYQVDI